MVSLVVLDDGSLASGSEDKKINIWNTNTGELIRTLTGHRNEILALTTLTDGTLVSGSEDKTIKLWNTK